VAIVLAQAGKLTCGHHECDLRAALAAVTWTRPEHPHPNARRQRLLRMWHRTKRLVTKPEIWSAIRLVASLLLQEGCLSAKQVRSALLCVWGPTPPAIEVWR
jgi:hypothetical protein